MQLVSFLKDKVFILSVGLILFPIFAVAERMPRTVIAFYDSNHNEEIFNTRVHQFAEMPLNHLGLLIRYHNLHDELPAQNNLEDVRGVLLLLSGTNVPEPDKLLQWLITQMKVGKQVVVMGDHAFERGIRGATANPALLAEFWKMLGLRKAGKWHYITHAMDIFSTDYEMLAYEKKYLTGLPFFPEVHKVDKQTISYARVAKEGGKEKISDIVTIGKNGSYVAPGYSHIVSENGKKRYWYINPFLFFSQAFGIQMIPAPDTTTLVGNRIYYSHIDGDGWRNLSLVPGYKDIRSFSAEVILKEVLEKYPDFPVTVAPVAGDLDPEWFGNEKSEELARNIFRLPNIEAASHTYSHPFHWNFFEFYDVNSERIFLERYEDHNQQTGVVAKLIQVLTTTDAKGSYPVLDSPTFSRFTPKHNSLVNEVMTTYKTPRAFFKGAYDLNQDITGSIKHIEEYLPAGKRVEIVQWSGNTLPFANAIRTSRKAGVRNINGGDTRYDTEFDSVSWVMPVGRNVRGEIQIYASASNENTYTDLWTDRYYGFQFLTETLKRTESPIRLKPINVYYHMYSGERLASLNALKSNLEYVREQKTVRIFTSHYASIADGFYTTKLEKMGERRWRILERGNLQTFRFDRALLTAIDFSRSEGVIGQRYLHGSLYIALEPNHPEPVIALKEVSSSFKKPDAGQPYLQDSHWPIRNFVPKENGFSFETSGFGVGQSNWYLPKPGNYRVITRMHNKTVENRLANVSDNKTLTLSINTLPLQPVSVSVSVFQE